MFGKLREKALEKALDSFEDKIREPLLQKVELFRNLTPTDIMDDDKYSKVVVKPLWIAIQALSGGTIRTVQKFINVEAKFSLGLFHVRNQMIKIEDEKVSFDPEFSQKLVPTIVEAFKQKQK